MKRILSIILGLTFVCFALSLFALLGEGPRAGENIYVAIGLRIGFGVVGILAVSWGAKPFIEAAQDSIFARSDNQKWADRQKKEMRQHQKGARQRQSIEILETKRDVNRLLKALTHSDRNIRILATQALGNLRTSQAILPLISIIENDQDSDILFEAERALCKIGNMDVTIYMVGWLARSESRLQNVAVRVLDEISWIPNETDKELYLAVKYDPLIYDLGDEDEIIRKIAVKRLISFSPQSVRPLINVMRIVPKRFGNRPYDGRVIKGGRLTIPDRERLIQETASETLIQIGPPAIEPLLNLLKEKGFQPRPAITTLAKLSKSNLINEQQRQRILANDAVRGMLCEEKARVERQEHQSYSPLPSEEDRIKAENERLGKSGGPGEV